MMKNKNKLKAALAAAISLIACLSLVFITMAQKAEQAPKTEEVPQEMFGYLEGKTGNVATLPKYSEKDLMAWSLKRYRDSATNQDQKVLYSFVAEDLLIAQKLLKQDNLQRQRQGMRLAQRTNAFVFSTLKDKWLYARVYEQLLLPNLKVAYKERWQDLSQQRIVESAVGAFAQTGERDKQIAVLQLLLEPGTNQNTMDWARGQLAQVLASQKRYKEAITHLQAIESPNMSNVKKLIPQYEKQLQKQDEQQQKN